MEIYALGIGHNTPVFLDLAMACGYTIAGLYHYNSQRTGEVDHGYKILGSFDDLFSKGNLSGQNFMLTMGDLDIRASLAEKIIDMGGMLPTLIHPTAVISAFAKISNVGSAIFPFTFIQSDSTVGRNTVILSHVNISHNTDIGNNCTIAGSAVIGAYTKVEDYVFVGQGALSISGKVTNIGCHSFIGARSLLTHDVPPYMIVSGSPAKPIRKMNSLAGKKLLVIGGAFQHCKVVKAAHKMGVIVYVVDYLDVEDSPAKQIADKSFKLDIYDIDGIVDLCIKEQIDGVIACALDPCQRPYQQVCERLGLPCFGTKEQFFKLTDKNAFKKMCIENGVDVIPSYLEDDIIANRAQYPILVKPCDSRGSRGQSICQNQEEAIAAIQFAKTESSNGDVVIEKYMGDNRDFSMTYLMVNGKVYLTRTGNRYLGSLEDGLDKVCIAGISPSAYTDMFLDKVNARVVKMLSGLGLSTAPVFMQGFIDGNTVRFYDPGLRFPGMEYEEMYEHATGFNPVTPLVEYALTAKVTGDYDAMDGLVLLNGKIAVDLLVALRPGKVTAIKGIDEIKQHPAFVTMFSKIGIGETVQPTHNVNQRFCEIDLVTDTKEEMKRAITWIYNTLRVEDENGDNMVVSKLDVDLIS